MLQGVYVPEMHEQLTRRRVLVMEWVDGVRLRSAGEVPGSRPALSREDLRLVEVCPPRSLFWGGPSTC